MPSFETHKTYKANEKQWRFYADAYEIGPDLRTMKSALTGENYITKFDLENSIDYSNRLKRAAPIDICVSGVDLMVGSISDIHAEIPSGFEELWQDADLQDTSMEQLLMEARTKAAIYGHCFLLVDSTRAQTEIVTEADVAEQGIRPFVRVLTPLDVINWRLDSNGKLVEVIYKCVPEQETSILDGNTDDVEEFRYWSRTEWHVYRNGSLVDQGVNPIGRVPLVTLYHKKRAPMLGASLISKSSKYQQTLTNWFSQIDKIQEQQSFSQAVLTSEATPTEVGIGVSTVLHLKPNTKDGGGKEEFTYVAPDIKPLELAWDSFYKTISMAVSSMSLPGDVFEDKHSKSAPESGVAKAYRWKNTDKRLLVMSLNEQEAAREVMELCGLWMGREFTGSIQYPTTFDLSGADDAISNLLALSTIELPQSAKVELMKQALTMALPRTDSATMTAIEKDLESQTSVDERIKTLTTPPSGVGE